jgi:catechol 2,3-dioxygenase-like lactoylglutathione lyase family enzyme
VFDHVTIRVSHPDASKRFYELVLQTIGIELTYSDEHSYEWDDFSLSQATDEKPVTQRLHIGFAAYSRTEVDAFWQAGTEAGYRDDGAPGPRPIYRDDYYGAFLLDPDGNSIEAVHHGAVRPDGGISHLWLRVADVNASKTFYETIAPHCGFRLRSAAQERAHFGGESGSFTVVEGRPTENVHMAFPASDNATVESFHATATAAGYRDNGPPGERAIYHGGYYGAYVLDPDGNNVEVVNHNRA